MASTTEAKKPQGVLAFDIEATGSCSAKDIVFAVGFAHIPMAEEILDSKNPERLARFKTLLRKQRLTLDLQKPAGTDWRDFWVNRGFSIKTFDDFWSQHLAVLDQLQAETSAGDEQAFADQVNNILKDIEAQYSSVTFVSDTLTFDVPFLSALLVKHGHLPLCKSRAGGYQGGCEVDSFVMGTLRLPITTSWQQVEEARAKFLTPLRNLPRVHDHNPENDAVAILDDFVTANVYANSL